MGASSSSQYYRTKNKEWFMQRTVAGNPPGKYKTLNKIPNGQNYKRGWRLTGVPGYKPLLVHPSADGNTWLISLQMNIVGQKLRVVDIDEVTSFGCLMHVLGHCLVTFADVTRAQTPRPLCSNGDYVLYDIFQYFDLVSEGTKEGRMEIAIKIPERSESKYIFKRNPTWSYLGTSQQGAHIYQFHTSTNTSQSWTSHGKYISRDNTGFDSFAGSMMALYGRVNTYNSKFDWQKIFLEETRWIII